MFDQDTAPFSFFLLRIDMGWRASSTPFLWFFTSSVKNLFLCPY